MTTYPQPQETNSLVPELNVSASEEEEDQCNGFSMYDLGFLAFVFMVLVSVAFLAMCRSTRPTQEERVKAKPASEDVIESQLIVREWNDIVGSSAVDGVSLNQCDDAEKGVQVNIQNHRAHESSTDTTVSVASNEPPVLAKEMENCSSSEDEGTLAECAICLAPFENGQKVCESNNMSCKHIFHSECILSWLRKHNECPVCRQIFLLETA